MLRYNNQSTGVGFSKPVDYFRPLTVDVSVEYELPKEVAPPPGSAPLLIIHPSAYYRSKIHNSHSNSQNSQNFHSSHNGGGSLGPSRLLSPNKPPNNSNSNQNPTTSTYFLRSSNNNNGLQLQNQSQSHIYAQQSTSTKSRYSNSSSSISRSRSMNMPTSTINCPYGKCDECASSSNSGGCGRTPTTTANSTSTRDTRESRDSRDSRLSSKKGFNPNQHQAQGHQVHPTDPSNFTINYYPHSTQNGQTATTSNSKTSTSNPNLMMDCTTNTTNTNIRTGSKRLRMSQNLILPGAEPLNLALATNQNSQSQSLTLSPVGAMYLNQNNQHHRQSYNKHPYPHQRHSLGVGLGNNGILQMINAYSNNQNSINSTPVMSGMSGLGNGLARGGSSGGPGSGGSISGVGYRALVTSTGMNLNPFSINSFINVKEGPIPVDKGSGSDSGVCSENESDVSPPMAPYANKGTQGRSRSLFSQELQSGCYCCCCPATSGSDSSSRTTTTTAKQPQDRSSSIKSSSLKMNTRSGSSTNSLPHHHPHYSLTMSSASASSYGINGLNTHLISVVDSPMGSGSGNSPMDSSSSPATYRKWFLPPDNNHASSQFGRWFQV